MKKKVLLFSYSREGSYTLRIISNILRKKYAPSFLFIDELAFTYRKPEETETDIEFSPIVEFCKDYPYIMISATSYFKDTTFRLFTEIKKRFPGCILIIGGPLATTSPAECLKHSDYVCRMETVGVLELLEQLDAGKSPKCVGNFIGERSELKKKIMAEDLDKLPPPDYTKDNEYHYSKGKITKIDLKNKMILYESIRGCIFNCSYCQNMYYNRIKSENKIPIVRKKSIRKAISDLKAIKEQVPELERFEILDDNFLAHDTKSIKKFVSEYNSKVNIPVGLIFDLRSKDFDDKVREISKLKSLTSVCFGVQTGSEMFNLKVYNRAQKNSDIIRKYNLIKKVLMPPGIDMIFGHPEEKVTDLVDTINLMLKLPGAEFEMHQFLPLPLTKEGEKYHNTEHTSSYSILSRKEFFKEPFYYFFIFFIKYMNTYHLESLLPKQFKRNKLTGFLNSKLFAPLYYAVIYLSIWLGFYKRRKRFA